MRKPIIKIVLGVIMLGLVVSASACAVKPEPEYAGSITEGILTGMNENDYAKFSEHFDEVMKNAIPEATFKQDDTIIIFPTIKEVIGDYVPESKEFWKVEEQEIYTVIRYNTKYTDEPASVIVTVSFREIDGEIYVSGLWFNSPKLRGQ